MVAKCAPPFAMEVFQRVDVQKNRVRSSLAEDAGGNGRSVLGYILW